MTLEGKGMKKQWMIIGTCALLVSMGLSGCDQLLSTKPNHVTVNVMVAVYVTMLDEHNNIVNISTNGIPVTIIMTKNGGDQLVFQRIVQGGLCQATGVIDLSKGQYIECNATVQGGYDNYYPVAPGYAKLTWDTVNASTNYGDMYSWYPHLTIDMKQQAP
jgi:hypothetical protein